MFKKIIRIPNKSSFKELSLNDVGLMIEADSSLTDDGNDYFSSVALDEFLHFRGLKGRPDLQTIREKILKKISESNVSGDVPSVVRI